MAGEAVLVVQGLAFGYGVAPLFTQWSAAVPAGLTLVQGGESAGKTTLLRLLAGEVPATAGSLVLAGADLHHTPARYRAQVFWVDPRAHADSAAIARDWLRDLPAQHPHWDAAALAAHVVGFALEPHLDKPFLALSTGSRRKVLMAAALASGAPLTLIDEPLAGLDKPSAAYLAQALQQAGNQPGRAIVVAQYEPFGGLRWPTVLNLAGTGDGG